MVTSDNVDEYIASVIDAVIGGGVQAQAKALREGFSKVFPIKDLAKFTVDELVMLFGNSDEDWSEESKWTYFIPVAPSLTMCTSVGRGAQGRPWVHCGQQSDSKSDRDHGGIRFHHPPQLSSIHHWQSQATDWWYVIR